MILSSQNLSKHFKDKIAVNNVNLNITDGVWGLLGANGAGKTTLIRMLCAINKPTAGDVQLDGIPIEILGAEYRKILGYLPQNFGYYPEFTVQEFLMYIASLKGLKKTYTNDRIQELLFSLSLLDVRKKAIKNLSGGMQRRVGIAQAMLNEPHILILDEPTSGLDPAERVKFRKYISEFSQGRIVIISTHIVSDVEAISSQNILMKSGKISAVGTSSELILSVDGMIWEDMIKTDLLPKFEEQVQIVNVQASENEFVKIRYISNKPVSQTSLSIKPNLEDVYMYINDRED